MHRLDMTRHHIGLEDAKSVLDSRISHFATALKNAVQTWNDDLGSHHDTLDEFARGVIISQFWYAESLQAFRGDSGVLAERKRRAEVLYC